LARARRNESARSTQRKAEQNDRDFRQQAHESLPSLSLSFSRQPAPSAAGK
jgi:hypothetical protein